jgi:hypothetical protein
VTALGWWPPSAVVTPEPKEGTIMEILIVAAVALAAVGLYRYNRTHSAR